MSASTPSRPVGLRAFWPFAVRDALVLGITLVLVWADAEGRARGETGGLGTALGLAAAVGAFVSAFFVHEWGHLLAALGSGAVVEAPARLLSVFLFSFDTARSTPRQFLAMSVGGYAASVSALGAVILWADPSSVSGKAALALVALGVAVTIALEVPTTLRVARGGPLPGKGGVYV